MSAQFPTEADRNRGKPGHFKLYEIQAFLEEAIDRAFEESNEETGEISEDWFKFLDDCQMARDDKALSIVRYSKSCRAEADAIKAEKLALDKRQRTLNNKADRLESYVAGFIKPGEKLSDATAAISWRKSSGVVVTDESSLPVDCFKVVKTVLLTSVKDGIKAGTIPENVARIEERQNIQFR